MFRPPSGHLQVFMLCILKEPAACYFLSFRCCTLHCFCYDVPCFPCAGVRVSYTHTSIRGPAILALVIVAYLLGRCIHAAAVNVSRIAGLPTLPIVDQLGKKESWAYLMHFKSKSSIPFSVFCLSRRLKWNQVHCYCDHLLASCTYPGWQIVMIAKQLVKWMIGRGNRSTRRKSIIVPIYSPQIPHDLNRGWTRASTVGSRRLTACELLQGLSLYLDNPLCNDCSSFNESEGNLFISIEKYSPRIISGIWHSIKSIFPVSDMENLCYYNISIWIICVINWTKQGECRLLGCYAASIL
jgi:hypothetical protein